MEAVTLPPRTGDPLVAQAVILLAKAMVIEHDRGRLWETVHEQVDARCRDLDDAAIRDALADVVGQFRPDAVARVAAAMAEEDSR
jgi:hypothetical protein